MAKLILLCLLGVLACATAQRITTIHLDGVQYFISRMNPYSPELNYFLAYQYCRSLGLQLASFETKEKAESMTTYLKNAGYSNYDFWTSGNRLGTGMFLWMSTGLPFNATFDFFENSADAIQTGLLDPVDHNSNTAPQRTARDSSSGAEKGCVILKQPALKWMPEDCSAIKDFICEQTRCYYYNYGSIPVSSAQGRPVTSTTPHAATVLMNFQSSTTPLPIVMSTYAALSKKIQNESESAPSFVSLKLEQERALEKELEAENEENHDVVDTEEELDAENDTYDEHARDLGNLKEKEFANSANDLHQDEAQVIEELHQQLKDDDFEGEKDPNFEDETQWDEESSHEVAAAPSKDDIKNMLQSNAGKLQPKIAEVSTSTAAPPVEVRVKQISHEIEKMKNNASPGDLHNSGSGLLIHDQSDIGRQSFLSLSDLLRTLRPNDKQIIPQIDSDYSNAMRVQGEVDSGHQQNRALF